MLKLDFVNQRGDVLPLSANQYFVLTNVDGMTSAAASISSNVVGGVDGDTVNNVQTQPRTVIFDLRIKSDANVEAAKREILRVIKLKQYGALIWTQRERTVEITGIVESIDMPRWTDSVTMQVALHCETPYWLDVENVVAEISEAIALHYFTDGANDMLYFPEEGIPFGEYDTIRTKSVYNSGDVAVGLEITINALETVTNPIIYGANNTFFGIGYGTGEKQLILQSGDRIEITTGKGNKTVKFNGVNVFDKIKPQSTWLQLATGDNTFSINSDDTSTSNMNFVLLYKRGYV